MVQGSKFAPGESGSPKLGFCEISVQCGLDKKTLDHTIRDVVVGMIYNL